jgi:hypothetical protein
MSISPGFALARALFVFLILLAVWACARLNRLPAVGVTDTDRASVDGISESDTAAPTAFGRRLYEYESRYPVRALADEGATRILVGSETYEIKDEGNDGIFMFSLLIGGAAGATALAGAASTHDVAAGKKK